MATILESFFRERIVARLEFMVMLGSEVFVLLNKEKAKQKKKKSKIFREDKLLSKILCNSFHHWF